MSNNELKKSIPIKTYNQTKKTLKGIISRKEADLYEANNRINDLLDIVKQKNKRIADLEYSLLDMVLQFADEDKKSINTMGLSALETAFTELDFDNPMPIKEVHKLYKELAKKYFEERCK